MAERKAGFLTQPLAAAVLWCIMAIQERSQRAERPAPTRLTGAYVHTHACTPATNLQTNCTQIDLIGSPSGLWATTRGLRCAVRISAPVWSQSKYYMKKNNVEPWPNCIKSLFTRSSSISCSLSEYDSLSGFFPQALSDNAWFRAEAQTGADFLPDMVIV